MLTRYALELVVLIRHHGEVVGQLDIDSDNVNNHSDAIDGDKVATQMMRDLLPRELHAIR